MAKRKNLEPGTYVRVKNNAQMAETEYRGMVGIVVVREREDYGGKLELQVDFGCYCDWMSYDDVKLIKDDE